MKATFRFLAIFALLTGIQHSFGNDADLSRLAAANNDFAFKLLKQLATEQSGVSIFISPYSAATALQMVGNGAAGRTRAEMQQVLGTYDLSTAALNKASKAAADLLDSSDTNLILTTANALWYRQGVAIKPGFTNANGKFFDATVMALDFNNPTAAEAEIDQWASDKTHGRIQGIADGMIDSYTDLILANAIYFKGKWEDPFDAKLTQDRPFHPAAGGQKNLPMMEMSKTFAYRKGTDYQAVRLPYVGYNLAMYVFLPDAGSSPEKLLQIMNGDKWRRVTMPGFGDCEGTVVLPKFRLEYAAEFNQPLNALGMKTAFNIKKADLSGMFSDPHCISEVRQKAFIEVNEEGTEAAAVTGGGVMAGMEPAPPPPFKMIVDRPFLFAIVDARSEMILFMGLVNDL
ncbi:MAG TPA: serpin family protein [Candidatus Acidoferrales bacterium]|nr:serpin family protein [Candidatus Acidoferrales bacterium]